MPAAFYHYLPGSPRAEVAYGDRRVFGAGFHALGDGEAAEVGVEEAGDVAVACAEGVYDRAVDGALGVAAAAVVGQGALRAAHRHDHGGAEGVDGLDGALHRRLVLPVVGEKRDVRARQRRLRRRIEGQVRAVKGHRQPHGPEEAQIVLALAPQGRDHQIVGQDEIVVLRPQGKLLHDPGIVGREHAVAVLQGHMGRGRRPGQDLHVAHVHALTRQRAAHQRPVAVAAHRPDKGGLAPQPPEVHREIHRVPPGHDLTVAVVVVHTAVSDAGDFAHNVVLPGDEMVIYVRQAQAPCLPLGNR